MLNLKPKGLRTLAIHMRYAISSVFLILAHNTDCFVLRTPAILLKFAPVPFGTLCSFPLRNQKDEDEQVNLLILTFLIPFMR